MSHPGIDVHAAPHSRIAAAEARMDVEVKTHGPVVSPRITQAQTPFRDGTDACLEWIFRAQ